VGLYALSDWWMQFQVFFVVSLFPQSSPRDRGPEKQVRRKPHPSDTFLEGWLLPVDESDI
jgi:hypothetical protein